MPISGGHAIWAVLLIVIALIIWGPHKLPDIGAGMGRAIREFRKASTETRETFQQAIAVEPSAPASAPAQTATVTTDDKKPEENKA